MTDIADRLARLSPEKRALLALRLSKGRAGDEGGTAAPAPPAELPQVIADPANRHEPFALTDLQQAYWLGRSGVFAMGDVSAHVYREFEAVGWDVARLQDALRKVIARHDMLRARVGPDGRQQILAEVPPYEIVTDDLSGVGPEAARARLADIRARMSHQVLPSDRWPLFEVRAALLRDGRVRLFVSLDGLFLDAWSISLLLREWMLLYRTPDAALPTLDISFRDYVLADAAREGTEAYARAEAYWRERLATLPPAPALPLAVNPAALKRPTYVRRRGRLEADAWQRLKARAARAGMTSTAVLMAAYAEVVALWGGGRSFALNVPRFNRLPLHPQVNDLVGEFASFTLLAVDRGDEAATFEERAKALQQQLWADLDHSEFNGMRVLRALSQAQGATGGAAVPVVFTSLAQDGREDEAASEPFGEAVFAINQSSQVWLDNHVAERAGGVECDWDSVDELFPPGFSQAMFDAYFRLLNRLALDEAAWQESAAQTAYFLFPPAQAERRTAANATEAPIPDVLLQDLFAGQARLRPGQRAVVAGGRTLTYGELYALACRWGRLLRAEGAKPNTLVAVVMEKGWEQIVAVLGIVQSGAAYLPIDAAVPKERLFYLLENAGVGIVLTQGYLDRDREWPEGVRRFVVTDDAAVAVHDDAPLEAVQTADDLAYVIYTSGSTGMPKGVMIAQRGVVNCVVETNRVFGIGPDDRALALTALHHDMSVYDLFGILGAGGTLVLPDAGGVRDPAHWSELLLRERVTVWNSVPAMMEMLLEYAARHPRSVPESLHWAFLGGDWIPITIPDRLRAQAPGATVVSVGGPTETTLWNIWYSVESVDPAWKSIPYGRPIANTKYYALNADGEDCPDWVPGELCCAGVGVAKGYWQDPARTAEKFLVHARTGERLYRTGDLGRYLPDGTIEFLGRVDFQVKIQGYRIELGEVEAALVSHPGVRAAVAAAVGESQEKKRLVAYIVPESQSAPDADALRAYLGEKLPPHMVPVIFQNLDQLPLTANGKVDRRALPALSPETPTLEAPGAAVDPAEAAPQGVLARITALVGEVLAVPSVDPDNNLLTLGADSIDMVRIGNLLDQAFGFRPRLDQLFRMQSVAALAAFYDEQLGQQAVSPEAAAAAGGGVTGAGLDDEIAALLREYKMLLDPAERDAFKNSRPGIRRGDDERPTVALPGAEVDDETRRRFAQRRSYRAFSLKPVPLESFGKFLGALRVITLEGKAKWLYPSPGGLYPGQVYLHVKPGRVEGVGAGTYYYHPEDHRLVSLTPGAQITRDVHIPYINTPIYDEAAFSLLIVTQLAAIAPSYGDKSLHFATLEAGVMAQLMEVEAREQGIGLCQIGSIDFDQVRHLFALDRSHVLIHSLLGGLVAPEGENPDATPGASEAVAVGGADRVATLMSRIKQLSPEEVKALLEANQ